VCPFFANAAAMGACLVALVAAADPAPAQDAGQDSVQQAAGQPALAAPQQTPRATPGPGSPPPPLRQIQAHRVTQAPRIDGNLDDLAWQTPATTGLIQNEPTNGAAPVRETRFWIAYDDEALYAAFRMCDAAPDSVDRAIARRDDFPNTDAILLELDPYNDDRNGSLFMVSAGGAVLDEQLYNDGWDDPSWDGVWESAAAVDAQGWTAEMMIPFSQLRFPARPDQVWGINVSRRCKRNQERDDLFHRARTDSGHISRFPDLVGLSGIHAGGRREAWLYGLGKGEYLQTTAGNPFNDGSKLHANLGADLKWGLASNLTLNATVNPDFGQVEIDPAVVNLSDVETIFDEKRPFFVQDSNTFNFGRDGTNNNWNFNWMDPNLLYTRRIGRNPQLSLQNDPQFTESPTGTTILGAAKLTGRLGSTNFGALSALTSNEYYHFSQDGVRGRQLAEPLTNYTVLRGTRASHSATSALGFMATSTQRDLSDSLSRTELARHAYTGGVDGWTYLGASQRWAMRGYLSGSLIQGDPDAIAAQQTSSRRYYQRPDANHLQYDPTRTDLAGWMGRLMLNKQKGDITLNTAVGAVSPGYEINDLGFQFRSDVINTHLALGRRWTQPNRLVRFRDVSLASYWTWDFNGTRNGGGLGAFYSAQFTNYWSLNGNFFYNPSYESTRATRGGPLMRLPVHRELYLYAETDSRKIVRFSVEGGAGEDTQRARNAWAGLGLTLKPSSALTLTLRPSYSWEQNQAQYVDVVDDSTMVATYGHRYVFSDLAYRELGMSVRADWAFTPHLTLQGYVQPLIAMGDYTDLKEFAQPDSYRFSVYGRDNGSHITLDPATNRYIVDPDGSTQHSFDLDNPDFNFKSLRINLVLRWEYRPGSTFFLVWTRNGTDEANPGTLNMGRDVDSLFKAPSDNVVLAKITTWLDF
jgi:hypothetical protein